MSAADQIAQVELFPNPALAARLLMACPDPLLLVDRRGIIRYANRAATQLTGCAGHELLGLSVGQLVPPELRRRLRVLAREVEQLGKVSCRATKVRHRNGLDLPVEVSIGQVGDGPDTSYIIVGREISDRVQVTEEALHAERLRALGEIATGVAHEFRNMLAAILGRTQLLLMKIPDPSVREALHTIEIAALDGAETVKRIMRYGTGGGSDQAVAPIDLKELLEEVIAATRYRWLDEPQRQGRRIEMEAHIPSLPPIEGRPHELRQFFTNLLANACEAMPTGGRIIVAAQPGPTTVSVTVSDTGVGMSPAVRERIFDSFFTTKHHGGVGLGLTIGKQAIQRHGGQITVNSAVGEGTAFTVTLPRGREAMEPMPEPRTLPPAGQGARILVVDDDPMLCEVLKESISALGYQVTMANSSQQSFRELNVRHFDVVITDLGLPDIPGSAVAQAAKRVSPRTHVIMLTGWDNPLPPAQRKYVDEILIKPVSVTDLGAAIEAGLVA